LRRIAFCGLDPFSIAGPNALCRSENNSFVINAGDVTLLFVAVPKRFPASSDASHE